MCTTTVCVCIYVCVLKTFIISLSLFFLISFFNMLSFLYSSSTSFNSLFPFTFPITPIQPYVIIGHLHIRKLETLIKPVCLWCKNVKIWMQRNDGMVNVRSTLLIDMCITLCHTNKWPRYSLTTFWSSLLKCVYCVSLHYHLCNLIKYKKQKKQNKKNQKKNNHNCPSSVPYYLKLMNICILICILMWNTLHGIMNIHRLRRDLAGGEGFDVPNEVRWNILDGDLQVWGTSTEEQCAWLSQETTALSTLQPQHLLHTREKREKKRT